MLREESVWIRGVLEETDLSSVKDVLDIGSSTTDFRTQIQPHIDTNVFKPLRDRGKRIYYLDQKDDEGVDLVFNIENDSASQIGKSFDLVICCNLMEHVHNPQKLARMLMELVKHKGLLLVTVPHTYLYHPDPIDTMFRPDMEELISMFPEMKIVRKEVINIKRTRYTLMEFTGYIVSLLRQRGSVKYAAKELIRYLVPFINWKVNCLFMEKD
jgi:SAM-dependent methyltransferase